MKDPKQIFARYCRDRGMRYTSERDLIVAEIYREDGHFDIDELFLRIRTRHPETKLAKGSIYRTLPHLIECGLVRVAMAEGMRVCYEHTLGHSHHDHMKCVACGCVFEFYDQRIDDIQQELCGELGFEILWHTHVVGGYCSACRMDKGPAGEGGLVT